jgi:hypothetical protein
MLTGSRAVTYAQKEDNTAFRQHDDVLPLPVVWGADTEPFRGPGNHPLTPHWHQDRRSGKTTAQFQAMLVEGAR